MTKLRCFWAAEALGAGDLSGSIGQLHYILGHSAFFPFEWDKSGRKSYFGSASAHMIFFLFSTAL